MAQRQTVVDSEGPIRNHPVRRLTRTEIGPVRRGNLRTGEVRELDAKELGRLLDIVGL